MLEVRIRVDLQERDLKPQTCHWLGTGVGAPDLSCGEWLSFWGRTICVSPSDSGQVPGVAAGGHRHRKW